MFLASRSFVTCATVHLDGNNHPLHTILVHFASLCFGTQPWCLRMPSLIAGVLLIPATYLALREIFDPPTGLLAAALVVPSPALLEYSTNARGYSVQTLFFVSLLFCAAKVLRGGGRRAWLGVGSFAVLALYTIPSSIYFCAAIFAWLLLSAARGDLRTDRRRFALRLAITSASVAAIVALPVSAVRPNVGARGDDPRTGGFGRSHGESTAPGSPSGSEGTRSSRTPGIALPLAASLVASFAGRSSASGSSRRFA